MVLAVGDGEMTSEDIRRIRESIFDEMGTPLTHQKFAALIGVSVAAVSRWENKHFSPSPLAREKIRDAYARYRGKRVSLSVGAPVSERREKRSYTAEEIAAL